jgi:predicted aldo/keto reductase-like oxidoreductase
MAQVALAWVISKPYVSSVLAGASRVAQLAENIACLDIQLTQAQLARLDNHFAGGTYVRRPVGAALAVTCAAWRLASLPALTWGGVPYREQPRCRERGQAVVVCARFYPFG